MSIEKVSKEELMKEISGELSEDQLETVAGGYSCRYNCIISFPNDPAAKFSCFQNCDSGGSQPQPQPKPNCNDCQNRFRLGLINHDEFDSCMRSCEY